MFAVPASKASKGQDVFEFTIGADTFTVRKAKFCPIDDLIEVESSPESSVRFFAGSTAKQSRAVGALDREQFGALIEAWREDSEVSAGEAPASAS